MKNKLLFILICLCTFIFPVIAEDVITYKETLLQTDVKDIVSFNNGYFALSNNQEIIKYENDNKKTTSKIIDNLYIHKLTKMGDHIVIIGEKENLLNIQIFDENLRSERNYVTDVLFNNSDIRYYEYKSNIYIILSIEGIISNNKIIIINEELDYSTKNISEIEDLESIIQSDYYYYDNNDEGIKYVTSASLNDNNYLVGYKQEEEQTTGILKNIKTNQIITNDGYKNIDAKNFNEYLALLSTNDLNSKLTIYDENGNKIEEKDIDDKTIKLSKIHNNLAIICEDKIILYNYEIKITKENNLFGNLEIIGEIKPFNEIAVEVKPNSGYELEKINVQTLSGIIIPVHDNKFIMPADSIKINADYKETVINPETIDPILLFAVLSIILIVVLIELYQKYKWLK